VRRKLTRTPTVQRWHTFKYPSRYVCGLINEDVTFQNCYIVYMFTYKESDEQTENK